MAGVKSGVVLDCLYTLRPHSTGLVVAWYFNNSARPVYQWIPGQKPISIGVFRHRANLDYKVSDDNETMHRYWDFIRINVTVKHRKDLRQTGKSKLSLTTVCKCPNGQIRVGPSKKGFYRIFHFFDVFFAIKFIYFIKQYMLNYNKSGNKIMYQKAGILVQIRPFKLVLIV